MHHQLYSTEHAHNCNTLLDWHLGHLGRRSWFTADLSHSLGRSPRKVNFLPSPPTRLACFVTLTCSSASGPTTLSAHLITFTGSIGLPGEWLRSDLHTLHFVDLKWFLCSQILQSFLYDNSNPACTSLFRKLCTRITSSEL